MSTSLKNIKNFVGFAAKYLHLSSLPHIRFVGAVENKKQAFGHFNGKQGNNGTITVRVTDRHPLDVMRTIAHELIHHKQRMFRSSNKEQMREDEANVIAGRIMKEYNTRNPNVFNNMPISSIRENEIAANAMGGSNPDNVNSAIAGFHPILGRLKRKPPQKLRDIIGHEEKKLEK